MRYLLVCLVAAGLTLASGCGSDKVIVSTQKELAVDIVSVAARYKQQYNNWLDWYQAEGLKLIDFQEAAVRERLKYSDKLTPDVDRLLAATYNKKRAKFRDKVVLAKVANSVNVDTLNDVAEAVKAIGDYMDIRFNKPLDSIKKGIYAGVVTGITSTAAKVAVTAATAE